MIDDPIPLFLGWESADIESLQRSGKVASDGILYHKQFEGNTIDQLAVAQAYFGQTPRNRTKTNKADVGINSQFKASLPIVFNSFENQHPRRFNLDLHVTAAYVYARVCF